MLITIHFQMKFYHIIDIVATATENKSPMDKIIDVRREREVVMMKEQARKIIDFGKKTEQCRGVPSGSKSIMRMAGISIFAWRKYSNTYSTVSWS